MSLEKTKFSCPLNVIINTDSQFFYHQFYLMSNTSHSNSEEKHRRVSIARFHVRRTPKRQSNIKRYFCSDHKGRIDKITTTSFVLLCIMPSIPYIQYTYI